MKTNEVARKRTLKTPKGTTTDPKLSSHIKNDRLNRMTFIAKYLEFGNIIKEVRCESEENGVGYKCITDTGVILIKSEDRTKIVTGYVASMHQLLLIYKQNHLIPYSLRRTVISNEKRKMIYKSEHYIPETDSFF